MENHYFQWVNPLFLWPCSIATLNYQRLLKIAIEIVSFPIKNGDFPQFLYVYQRVSHRGSKVSIVGNQTMTSWKSKKNGGFLSQENQPTYFGGIFQQAMFDYRNVYRNLRGLQSCRYTFTTHILILHAKQYPSISVEAPQFIPRF